MNGVWGIVREAVPGGISAGESKKEKEVCTSRVGFRGVLIALFAGRLNSASKGCISLFVATASLAFTLMGALMSI